MRIAILDDYQSIAINFGGWDKLPPDVEIVSFTDHVTDEDRLATRLSQFDAVSRMRERTEFPRRLLERLPRLKLILATGLRHAGSIDLPAAHDLGITVCATESLHHPAPELTWGLILSLFRRIHHENAYVRAGGWQSGIGSSVHGKTLGIVGLGKLGSPVAQIGKAFGMNVIAWSPHLTQERADKAGAVSVSKADLFSTADVVTIHMPLSERSIGIIGTADLALMKPTAYLINTSRSPLIDQKALLDALRGERIAGLGVDVFDEEPLPLNHPYRYLPNVLATPHIGYVVAENYDIYFRETVENILAYLQGNPIRVLDVNSQLAPRN